MTIRSIKPTIHVTRAETTHMDYYLFNTLHNNIFIRYVELIFLLRTSWTQILSARLSHHNSKYTLYGGYLTMVPNTLYTDT